MTDERIVIFGAGAVGSYYGGMLATAGFDTTLIARKDHADRINERGLLIDRGSDTEQIKVKASIDYESIRTADLICIAVKSMDTVEAANTIKPLINPNALVLSLQNGVDNVQNVKASTGINAFASAVWVATRFTEPGRLRHNGRGDLVIGDLLAELGQFPSREDDLQKIASFFNSAKVPCKISSSVREALWRKLTMNCSYNGLSALTDSEYSKLTENDLTRLLIINLAKETCSLAKADGIEFDLGEIVNWILSFGTSMPNQVSSTTQDIRRSKRTEIDSLNGFVYERGRELGVSTPFNDTVYALVKSLEMRVTSGVPFRSV